MAVLCVSGAELLTPSEREAFAARLTARELEVFGQLAAGRDRRGIARVLGLSPHTVRTHIQKIFVKLDVHSMIEALALLRAAGQTSRANAENGAWPGDSRYAAALSGSSAQTRSAPV